MRPKFQHENSYACLLAEVLEEAEEKAPAAIRSELAARQTVIATFASSSVARRRRRRIGVAAASTTSSSAPAAATAAAAVEADAAAAVAPTPPSPAPLLVEIDDASLPEVLKFNAFVQTGYRRAPLSRRECLRSLCYCHNETFNVATHLVPLVLLAASLATGALSSTWPRGAGAEGSGGERDLSLLFHALPMLLCLAGSVCYHLFMADSGNYSRYLSVDVCGILALTVAGTRAMASRPAGCVRVEGSPLALLREVLVSPWAGSSPPPSAFSSPSPFSPAASPSSSLSWSSVSRAALARDGALASYAALVAFAASKALRGGTAVERGLPLLVLLLARVAVLAARAAEVGGLSRSSPSSSSPSPELASLRSSLGWYTWAEAASFSGGLVNVLRVPERWVKPLPSRPRSSLSRAEETGTKPRFRLVDFAFNSHNLMHLFSLVALGCYHAAAAEDRRYWLAHGCGRGSGAAAR